MFVICDSSMFTIVQQQYVCYCVAAVCLLLCDGSMFAIV